jgi:hypothetical protein
MKRKSIIYSVLLCAVSLSFFLWGCTKEPPVDTKADFTTDIVNDTAWCGEPINISLKNVSGDFVTIYPGTDSTNTYDPSNPRIIGLAVDKDASSFAYTYFKKGTYTLNIVSTSYGNWSADSKKVRKSITFTVADRRATMYKFQLSTTGGLLTGLFVDGGARIVFYGVKGVTVVNNLKAKFYCTNANCKVYVGGVEQVFNKTVNDYTNPVTYTVVADNGATQNYSVEFILNDPSKEATLKSLAGLDSSFIVDTINKKVTVYYLSGAASVNLKAIVSKGASAKIGSTRIDGAAGVAIPIANLASNIVVTAQDVSVSNTYTITAKTIEKINSFKFISNGQGNFNPQPSAVIDQKNMTMTLYVYSGTQLTDLVASFTGLTNYTTKVAGAPLVSGVTPVDYTNPVKIDVYDESNVKAFTYTVVVKTIAKK